MHSGKKSEVLFLELSILFWELVHSGKEVRCILYVNSGASWKESEVLFGSESGTSWKGSLVHSRRKVKHLLEVNLVYSGKET